jgi:uncharacterized protein YlbG (UPF0298 family)
MATPTFTRVDSVIETFTHNQPTKTTLSDLCDDVLLMICDLLDHRESPCGCPWKILSLTNRRLHALLAPELFKTLYVNAPIKSKQQDTLTRHHAHTLKVNMFGSLWWWCSGLYVDGSDAVDLFHFIHRLENLKTLEVSMMSRSMDIFEAALKEEKGADVLRLPRLEKLVVTSSAAFLTRHCPNLKTLVILDERDCIVEAYTDLASRFSPLQLEYAESIFRNLTLAHLDTTAIWSAEELSFVTTTFPHLKHLVMRSETYCYRASIPTIMTLLSSNLAYLKTLELGKISNLDMGYRSVWKRAIQECKTAEKRKDLWKENERCRVEAENFVARLAFGGIAGLKEVWVGEKRVAKRLPSVQMYGEERARWMWERERDYVDCSMPWASYREEKEDVVVKSESGI